MMSFVRFPLLYTSGSEGSRRTRGLARLSWTRARFCVSFCSLSSLTTSGETAAVSGMGLGTIAGAEGEVMDAWDEGTVLGIGEGGGGRDARSTVASVRTSRRSRASTGAGTPSGLELALSFAISRSRSSTAAAHISGSVSMGFGPQKDVSSNILWGEGERDTPDTTERRDTWLKADSAEHCEPTLDRRLVRPDTASSAASEPWLSLREWRRGAGATGAGARVSPGAPSRNASSSVDERRSSAPSSRKPSSRRLRASSPPPANSASSGELSRESW